MKKAKSRSKSTQYPSIGNKTYDYKKKQVSEITFLLIDDDLVGVDIPYKISTQEIRNIVKNYGGCWNREEKIWVLKKQNYESLICSLRGYCQENQLYCQKIPQFVLAVCSASSHQIQIKSYKFSNPKILKYPELEVCVDPESLPFYDKLYDFQKSSLKFGIQKHGRLLLADEMGVGKTIQSLAIAYIYRYQWPLLIICPSTLRYNWQNEILNWYSPEIKKSQIQIYTKGGATFRENAKILIISYDLAWKFKELISQFQVVIADQAHYLKNITARRTEVLMPILTQKKRVILLTGTPAFAKPKEIFNLASIIRPDLFYHFKSFGERYCEPSRNAWTGAFQYNGCKNVKQLFYLLKNKIMIRRLKQDVLSELPEKQRQKIAIETNKSITKQISSLISQDQKQSGSIEKVIMEMMEVYSEKNNGEDGKDRRREVTEAYKLTGLAKIEGVKDYILSLLENNAKILIFGHHQEVLNEIQIGLRKNHHKFIRIDGKVKMEERQTLVDSFQADKSIMAAILSISAAGVGLTLTASSTVVFAELHWTPALMIQAEDRAHRISQKNSVNCHYLIGENTLDPILYQYLQKKINNVSTFVDGTQHHLEMEDISKGQLGKVSKRVINSANKSGRKSEDILLKSYRKSDEKQEPEGQSLPQKTEIQSDIDSQLTKSISKKRSKNWILNQMKIEEGDQKRKKKVPSSQLINKKQSLSIAFLEKELLIPQIAQLSSQENKSQDFDSQSS